MNRVWGILGALGIFALVMLFFGGFVVAPSWKAVADKREALEKADKLVEVVVTASGYELHGRIGAHDAKIQKIDIDDPRIKDEFEKCLVDIAICNQCASYTLKQVDGRKVAIVCTRSKAKPSP